MIEADTMCLLDFYVHESMQRRGIGLELFQLALEVGVCVCGIYEKNKSTFNFHGVSNST